MSIKRMVSFLLKSNYLIIVCKNTIFDCQVIKLLMVSFRPN